MKHSEKTVEPLKVSMLITVSAMRVISASRMGSTFPGSTTAAASAAARAQQLEEKRAAALNTGGGPAVVVG